VLLGTYVTEQSARILGQETPVLKTEGDLEKYLADFVRLPAFHESLESLKAIASQPVVGVLRVGASLHAPLLADVTVDVAAADQHRLADASEATPPQHVGELHVTPVGPTPLGRGTYDPAQRKPHWLVAGGYALQLESDELEADGRIRLSGTPVPPSTLG
jgi:hypothetical protein